VTSGPAGENPGVPEMFSFVHELPLMARPVIWVVLAALYLFDARNLALRLGPARCKWSGRRCCWSFLLAGLGRS
jgi:hypothetical protein